MASVNGNVKAMLEKLYGIHESALALKARRMEVLSTNIANADTPGFKAKDIDFQSVLSWQLGKGALETTHQSHLASPHELDGGRVFTIPYNPSVDGNTVEIGLEQSKFGKAAMEYQATLDFLQGRVQAYKRALKGE
jgi:flagellar basal-body rod protein FlgB